MSEQGYGGGSQPTSNGDMATNAAGEPLVLIDEPAHGVRRVTLNRPEKRNALNNPLRGALIAALAVPTATTRCG